MFANTGSPAASAAEMDVIEVRAPGATRGAWDTAHRLNPVLSLSGQMQANARITAMLSGKEHPMPTSRVAAMRDALEAVMLHGASRVHE